MEFRQGFDRKTAKGTLVGGKGGRGGVREVGFGLGGRDLRLERDIESHVARRCDKKQIRYPLL